MGVASDMGVGNVALDIFYIPTHGAEINNTRRPTSPSQPGLKCVPRRGLMAASAALTSASNIRAFIDEYFLAW